MTTRPDQPKLPRRRVLLGLGGIGATLASGAALAVARSAVKAVAQAAASPAAPAAYTPPSIPQPAPTVGGVAPTVVGKQPVAAPVGSPTTGTSGNQAAAPGQPAVPAGTPKAGASPVAAPAATVTMTPDFKFDPETVTIKKGDTVQWKNAGRSPQTVTDDPALAADKSHAVLPDGAQPWNSGAINSGGTYSHTFDVAGDYTYFSMPQETHGMIGHITVQG